MSNDIISSSSDIFKSARSGLVSNTRRPIDADTQAIIGNGGGNTNKRISIKGGVFRKFVGGKEISALEDRAMNVVFVRFSPFPARTYYAQSYKEGEKIAPVCWSSDSKTPDPEVRNPPSSSCVQCPYEIDGSAPSGRGKACRKSWRTAVVTPDNLDGDVMQLVLPATSTWGAGADNNRYPFIPYTKFVASNGFGAKQLVTRMSFDTSSPTPKLFFAPVSLLSDEQMDIIDRQSESAAALAAVKLTVFQNDENMSPVVEPPVVRQASAPVVEQTELAIAPATFTESEPEPMLRESAKKADDTSEPDVTSAIKKWSKKK